jgi:hypothetical protein
VGELAARAGLGSATAGVTGGAREGGRSRSPPLLTLTLLASPAALPRAWLPPGSADWLLSRPPGADPWATADGSQVAAEAEQLTSVDSAEQGGYMADFAGGSTDDPVLGRSRGQDNGDGGQELRGGTANKLPPLVRLRLHFAPAACNATLCDWYMPDLTQLRVHRDLPASGSSSVSNDGEQGRGNGDAGSKQQQRKQGREGETAMIDVSSHLEAYQLCVGGVTSE